MNWKDLSAIRETLKEVKDPQMGSVLSSVVDAISGIRNLVMHTLGAKISIVTKDIPDVKNSTFLHVVAGDNDWIPGPDDLKELSELFHEVTDIPVIVTPTGISASFADFGLPPDEKSVLLTLLMKINEQELQLVKQENKIIDLTRKISSFYDKENVKEKA